MKTVRRLTGLRARAKSWRIAPAVVCLVFAAACGSSETSGPNGRPSGEWAGSLVSGTFTLTMDVVMVEDATGKVTGNGYITSALPGFISTSAATVSGTFVAPSLSVNLSSPGITPLNMSGKITGDTFNARLNGSGFSDETIVLTRQ